MVLPENSKALTPQHDKDKEIEQQMGVLLRTGVLASALLVLSGGILFAWQQHARAPHYRKFNGEPERLTHVRAVLEDAWHLHSTAVIQLGVLLLLFTPVARVLFSIYGFIKEKDRMYVVITLIVLGILSFSLFSGLGG
ncbi:DUF1634 domain-containing protein [Mucilaginibacter robiniae]|uniref:DUF1634 domain-containing protein n=1 Tax=Mucilaginibacter robiniae TaxID=2728022 RepID=A0A7L5E5F1_9SPHI|nr:DUF1634 domain-containing protein [Mucilaginibacter robiniae]QJD96073.1 DUF1634 domain-containing protein [Mucilaginibacter robiniae]